MYATESEISVYDEMLVVSSVANNSGGGLYLYFTHLNCQHSSTLDVSWNKAANTGGGIHDVIINHHLP